jgi:hypothetical protein
MNSRFRSLIVLLSLVMLIAVIPVTAAHGDGGGAASPAEASGTAASDSSVSASGGGSGYGDAAVSTGAGQGGSGADSLQGSMAPDSGTQQSSAPDTQGSFSTTGVGDSGEVTASSPDDWGQGLTSPAGSQESGGDDLAGQGQGPGSPAGSPEHGDNDIVSQGRGSGPESMGSSLASIPVKSSQGEQVSPPRYTGGQGPGGSGSGYSSGYGLQGPGPESQPVTSGGQRPVLLAAASLGGAGAAWQGSGQEGPSFPAGQGHAPPSRSRQQGPPAQPGQYPCGPAERGTPSASPAPRESEENGQPDKKPRSRREESLDTIGESGVPLSSPPDTTRLPLFSSILFLIGGYRRISRKNILDHDQRRMIYDMICRNPGIDSVTLATVTATNENTLRYHVAKLLAAGKITSLPRPSVVRYFQNQGTFDPREQVVWHYIWSDTPRQILMLLYRSPGLSRQNLADEIGISGPSVTRQMTQLIDDDLIENTSFGRTNAYYLTDGAQAALSRAFSFSPPVSQERAAQKDILSHNQLDPEHGQVLLES